MMMIKGEIEKADHAIFSDTGWEPKAVYNHLETLKPLMAHAGIEFHIVSSGKIQEDGVRDLPWFTINPDGSKGMARRQCTDKYKLKPLRKKQRELVGLKTGERSKEHLLISVVGISWDEVHRIKDPFYPWITNEYPLVDLKITREMCLEWMESNGFLRPPRSSCLGCPFHSDNEWRHIRDNYPEEFAEVIEFEKKMQADPKRILELDGKPFLHQKRVELGKVDLRTKEEHGIISLFNQECEGMCGL